MAMKKIFTATTILASLAVGSAHAGSGMPSVSLGGSMLFVLGHGDQSSNQEKALAWTTATGTTQSTTLSHMRETQFNSDMHLYVDAKNTSDAGLTYGFSAEVETVDGNNDNGDVRNNIGSGDRLEFTKAYAFMESGLGRLELGRPSGATKNMKVGAENIARGNGGIDGDFMDFIRTKGFVDNLGRNIVNNATSASAIATSPYVGAGVADQEFILHPDAYIECDKCGSRYANKVSYYTPMFSGFQLGVSFIPDTGSTGKDTFSSKNFIASQGTATTGTGAAYSVEGGKRPDFENVFDVALNYQNQFDMVGVTLGATGQFGKAEKVASGGASVGSNTETRMTEDLRAYTLGAKLTYQNFSLAGAWADFGDTGHRKTGLSSSKATGFKDDQYYWNIGLSWEQGPIGLGIGYMDSENNLPFDSTVTGATTPTQKDSMKNEFSNVVLSADYALAPGLKPFAEVSFFDMKYKGSTRTTAYDSKNRGTVFMIGTKVMF